MKIEIPAYNKLLTVTFRMYVIEGDIDPIPDQTYAAGDSFITFVMTYTTISP